MRYPDWQSRFWREIEALRNEPFKWGTNDCVLFAARMADAISDQRYMERARKAFAWTNEREALALTKGGLQPLVESVLGPAMSWVRLSHGDIVLIVDERQRESLSIHDGVQLIGHTQEGLRPIPFEYARCGWRIE